MYFAMWQLQLACKWLRIIGFMDSLFSLTFFFFFLEQLWLLFIFTHDVYCDL